MNCPINPKPEMVVFARRMVFLVGFCSVLMSGVYALFWSLERSLVEDIALRVEHSEDELDAIRRHTDFVHFLTRGRMGMGLHDAPDFVDALLSPTLQMLLKGEGACGHLSFLLMDVLSREGFNSKPALILNQDGLNVHVILQVSFSNQEVYLDPSYNWLYLSNDGSPIAEADFSIAWRESAGRCPREGILHYPIEHGFSYTNWKKFGIFQSPVMWLGEQLTGQHTDDISIRSMLPGWYASRVMLWLSVAALCLFPLAVGSFKRIVPS